MAQLVQIWLLELGIKGFFAFPLAIFLILFLIIATSVLADILARRYLAYLTGFVLNKAQKKWSENLFKQKVIKRFAHIAPALVIYLSAELLVIDEYPFTEKLANGLKLLATIFILFLIIYSAISFLNVVEKIYNSYEISKRRPIKTYLQSMKIGLVVFAIIITVGLLLNESPSTILAGFGAATAILVVAFRDTILGFVASIQLSSFDMLRLDDWVEMPAYGADGDVIEISLNSVKVRNFDKTITTIPTYAFMQTGVKNWRGMRESGGRRVKRAVLIDIQSIRFCDQEMLERFYQIDSMREYLTNKLKEISEQKQQKPSEYDSPLNYRCLTNIGIFRIYLDSYLKNHQRIHKHGFIVMVRQLEPTAYGLPLEVYFFTKSTDLLDYEMVQSDVFDHIFAALPLFGLRGYQSVSDGSC